MWVAVKFRIAFAIIFKLKFSAAVGRWDSLDRIFC
jgi:hypothetical protein